MVTRIERAFRTRSLSSTLGLSGALLVSACRYEAGSTGAAGADGTGTDDLGQANDPKSRDPVPPHDDPSPDPADSTPLPAAGIGGNVFGDETVLEVRLTLGAADSDALELDGDDETYLPAAATLAVPAGSQQLARIGIRHKGAYSLHHCFDEQTGIRSYAQECARLSYKLKFDEYAADARFDGLKRLNLHASSGDASIGGSSYC